MICDDCKDSNKEHARIMLLQGPHGPFFRKLLLSFNKAGFESIHVVLNAGDYLFAGMCTQTEVYRGGIDDWEAWLRNLIVVKKITHIVLYGSERPVHIVARRLANGLGLEVVSLEEGYIRPGNITVEFRANNALSPVAGLLPPRGFRGSFEAETSNGEGCFLSMCFYGALYYVAVLLFSSGRQKELLHRHIDLADEVLSWARNLCRRLLRMPTNAAAIKRLLQHHASRYFIIPLQVSQDMQMKSAARGWNNNRLIHEAIQSFAAFAPSDTRLVFKVHPLERGRNNDCLSIRKKILEFGVEHRVDIIDVGPIGDLTRHSAGMITINSTSGFSAIHHGVPLLVIGDAIYANDKLAMCAHGKPDFARFWSGGYVADTHLRKRYISWVMATCLRKGNFFTRRGMEASCRAVVDKVRDSCRQIQRAKVTA